jgi:glutamate/tyrosine decarboxylase-like PLP-dependent enzyme
MRQELWSDPRAMLGGSDAGAHLDRMCGSSYTTRFLGDCLRGRKLAPLARAVQMITADAADLFGLGTSSIRWIPTDSRQRMRTDALRQAIEADLQAGDVPAIVVGTAGSVSTGAVDPLYDIAAICREYKLWFHVDGAYGGAALTAPSVRHRFEGIERADSFIVDPHKWLFAPYDCCALLYRQPELARAVHAQHASYLDHIDRESWNPSDMAVHLTRRARGLPLWFSLATHGTDKYRDAVELTLSASRAVAEAIRASDHLRLVREPELSVVLFERPGWTLDDFVRAVSQARGGKVAVIQLHGVPEVIPMRMRHEDVTRMIARQIFALRRRRCGTAGNSPIGLADPFGWIQFRELHDVDTAARRRSVSDVYRGVAEWRARSSRLEWCDRRPCRQQHRCGFLCHELFR